MTRPLDADDRTRSSGALAVKLSAEVWKWGRR